MFGADAIDVGFGIDRRAVTVNIKEIINWFPRSTRHVLGTVRA